MPLVRKNGKWVSAGEGGDTTAYAPEQPPAPPKPKPVAKPWWAKVVNDLKYEAKQLQANPVQRLNTYSENAQRAVVAEAPSPNLLVKGVGTLMTSKDPINDLKYEAKQFSNPERANPRLVNLASTAFLGKTLGETAFLGNTQALANIARNAGDAGAGDYTDRGEAFNPDRFADESYRSGGFTPPSEMNEEQKAGDDARASLMLNLGIGAVGRVLLSAGTGLAYLGPLLARAQAGLNPANAKTALGAATRVVAGLGLEETLSTPLDDNTGGSFMSMVKPEWDPVKPGMSRNEASAAAFLPNLAGSATMVGSIGGLSRLSKAMPDIDMEQAGQAVVSSLRGLSRVFEAMPNTKRAKQAEAQRATRQAERAEQVQSGLIQEDDTGRTAFTEEALQAPPAKVPEAAAPAPDLATAEAQLRSELGAEGGVGDFAGTPKGELTVSKVDPKDDPWEIEYDPSTPESDGLGEVLNEASDQELVEIAQADKDIPTVADEVLSRPGEGYDPEARISNASASTDALAESPDGYAARLGQVSTDRLRSMAHPQNGTVLHDVIAKRTGKDWEQFTRADVIRGLEELESEGVAVMANRLMGAPMMDVNDIQVAPNRFQFKDNVDAQGQQKGNSLEGVERWNTDMEGTVQVWEDPQDGKTYVVNGHNRLAKAKALGIPSIRVEYLTAPTDLGARAQGALNNIADGSGTAFDAAKFFRESGVNSVEELSKTGIPMKSGLAVQGLALAKLPDPLFQKAVNGELSMGRALALGGSDLSPEDMIRVNQMAAGHDMTDRAFNEMVQMAGSAPQVASDQVGLFGTEMMDTIAIKADLAAKIRAELTSNKNLFKKVTRNKAAQALESKAGTKVDQGTATSAAETAQAVLGQFDADKYMEGTAISQMLNDGTAEIANGAKAPVVMKRILRQLEAAADGAPPAPKVVDEAPVEAVPTEPAPLNPAERKALKTQILSKAAQNGEVRPPSTPLLETPRTTDVPLQAVAEAVDRGEITPDVLKALDDEVRLEAEFAEFDAKVEAEVITAEREAIGYDNLTFEEKKATGMLDGWDAPVKRSLSTQFREQLQTLGESLGEHTRSLDQHFKTQEGFLEARRVDLEAQSQALQFQLPKDLSKSSPRFGMATLKFESDLDRAAYMLRDASKKSKGEDRLIAALEAEGYDIKEIRRLGQEVKARIQDGIQEATGSRRAPQQSMDIEVPASRVEADGDPARLALPDSAQLEANNLAIQSKEAEIAALKAQAQQGGC